MSQEHLFNQPFTSAPSTMAYHPEIQAPYMQFTASVPPRSQPTHLPQMTFQNPAMQNQDALLHQQLINPFSTSPYQRSESIGSSPTTSIGKQMQTKAERRAEHNAIERARRESLNSKFQQLAHCLPNLQNDSRPSKSTIIERTLDFVKGAIQKEERMQNQIKELERVNRYLLSQLDSKQQEHKPSSAANTPSPSSAMSEDSFNLDDELSMNEKKKFKREHNKQRRQTKRKESPGVDFPPSVSSHPEAVKPVLRQSCNQSVPMVPKQNFQINMPTFDAGNYAIPNNNKMKDAMYFQPQNQPMFQPLHYNSDNDDDEDNSMDMNHMNNNNNISFGLHSTTHNFQPMMSEPLSLNQLDMPIIAHDPYNVMQHRH